MSESSESNKHSYSTGTSGADSSAASDASDAVALNALQDRNDNDESLNDLLDSTRKLDEGVFATLLLLTKTRGQMDVRWVILRVLLEFLQIFRVVFNTTFPAWNINRQVLAYRAIRWVLIRGMILPKGYDTYIKVFYGLSAVILIGLALAAWLAVVMKKDDSMESSWLGKFNCKWMGLTSGRASVVHLQWGQSCLAMPHLAHMLFALFVVLVFCVAVLALSFGDCDFNPMTRNVLATPSASTHVQLIACKMAMIVLSTCADENPRLQSVGILVLVTYMIYTLVMSAGYYGVVALHAWVGLLSGVFYTTLILNISVFRATSSAQRFAITRSVLYGIVPSIALGAAVSALRLRLLRRPLAHLREAFADSTSYSDLRSVFRFRDAAQVEMLGRVMRKWDEDGVPDADASAFGEFIFKCGQARFPNNATLLIASANVAVMSRHDAQASRTQLQLAMKCNPSLIERYFIFATQDLTKKLKDESGSLDLMGYIEFQRNYRACVRAHKMALAAQRAFWVALLHDTIQFKSLQKCFVNMNKAETRAAAVYRKVLERYPTNGRLLKIYGRFVEWCKNEPSVANRYYIEAMKQGTGESLMALVGASASGEDGAAQQGLGTVDEREDGLIIINAAGIIMACNKPVLNMFGYEKGELEQKNVSCLMPQPFSSRHNGYLARYSSTGEARILNTSRSVVGLSKSHSVFPISLNVVKLSGSREEAIFMGLVRRARTDDDLVVRVWVAPGSGIVLTADDSFADCFGIPAGELMGRGFASLGADIQTIDALVSQATSLPPDQVCNGKLACTTKLLHRFLPPVEVEITVDVGGTDAERLLIMSLRCVEPPGALMVVSHKGRITYATSALAAMLGFPIRQLPSMDVQSLIPPPYSQLLPSLLKMPLSAVPPVTSCRAGAVVHLMRANGVKVPVKLQMTQHDDGERVQHIVKVLPSSETARMDGQRLVLAVGEDGAVLSVNPGAVQSLFGFDPQLLVGRRLSSFVSVFAEHARQAGDDVMLLTALALRAAEGAADDAWRVGITAPKRDGEDKGPAVASSVLQAALQQRNRERPALMSISLLAQGETNDTAAVDKKERPVVEVVLWRADAVVAVVEVDARLEISRADAAAGLLFGVSHRGLLKKDFKKLAGLPATTHPADLLVSASTKAKLAGQQSKKSGLKGGGAPKTGVRRTLITRHADGGELRLEMQAVTKPGTCGQLFLRLQLQDPSCGSLAPLQSLLRGTRAAAVPQLLQDAAGADGGSEDGCGVEWEAASPPNAAAAPTPKARRAAALEQGEEDEGSERSGVQRGGGGRGRTGGHGSPEGRRGGGGRVDEWVRQVSDLHEASVRGRTRGGAAHSNSSSIDGEEGPTPRRAADGHRSGPSAALGYKSGRASRASGWAAQPGNDDDMQSQQSGSEAGPAGAPFAIGAGASAAGESAGDAASQQSGSEAQDMASSVVGTDAGDDELVADFRRAKRLKKLTRLFTCSTAQSATITYRQRTWILTAIILGAHLAAFAVLVTQIESRYADAYDTATMARATDRFQLSAMRVNVLQSCGIPEYSTWAVCSQSKIDYYMSRLMANTINLRNWHQSLYLGSDGHLRAFGDKRIYDFWTSKPLKEYNWMDVGGNGTIEMRNSTLWTMGNKYIMNSWEVYFNAPTMRAALANTSAFNYMRANGPDAIFKGYAWSLDTFVDYAWARLGDLNTVLIVLLVVETLCVQLTCMGFLTMLVRAANAQHMKRFSVFLALPSATLRIMASRQLVVDDDTGMDGDDEELEGLDLGGGGDAGAGDGDGKQKSVRMADDVGDDDAPGNKSQAAGAKSSKSAGKKSAARLLAGTKKPKSLTTGAKIYKFLFGWLDTKVKINGKKLMPNSAIVLQFMAPLLLWAAAVVIVFGVSFTQLANLQGPLSSLNAVAHVTYRVSRVRLMGNFLAYTEDATANNLYRNNLLAELATLRSEYSALLYGGYIAPVNPDVKFDTVAPASTFANAEFADLFFKTSKCLRQDQSGCFGQDSQYYEITHHGLDAMITRWMDQYTAFANVPNELAFANHTLYKFINDVGGHDMVDGLYTAVDLFQAYTISRFESVKTLHVILLVISIVIIAGFLLFLFRPYTRLLHEESKDIAGLLSQLPAEVAIEDIAKTVVIGLPARQDGAATLATQSMLGAPFLGAGAKSTAVGLMPGAYGGYGAGFGPGSTGPLPPGVDASVALHLAGGPRGSYGAPPYSGGYA